jgi:hypothetical protein
MVPYGEVTTLMKNKDGETNKEISDLRGFKCDNCGYPEGDGALIT